MSHVATGDITGETDIMAKTDGVREEYSDLVQTYQQDGCTFTVYRQFERGEISLLKYAVDTLLDLMDKAERVEKDENEGNG